MSANTTTVRAGGVETADEQTCPECDGRVRPDGIDAVCAGCGLVVETDEIDRGPEWRCLDEDQTPRATPTAGIRHHDHGRGSEIGYSPDAESEQLDRMRTWHSRFRARGKERELAFGLTEVQRMASALDLPRTVTEAACRVFRDAHATEMFQGRTHEPHAAAALLIAARQADQPVTTDDVASVARLPNDERVSDAKGPRKVWNAVRRIGVELGIDTTPPGPVAFVPGLVDELGLPASVRADATRTCRRWQQANVHGGRKPIGVAAAAVWSESAATQPQVGEVAGVCPVTIRTINNDAPDGQTDLSAW